MVKDADFYVPEVDSAALIIPNFSKFTEIIRETSRVTDLFVMDQYIVIVALIGHDTYNEKYDAYGAENRKIRFYVLDTDMNHLDSFTFSMAADRDLQHKIWGANHHRLFFLSSFNLFGKESPEDPNAPLYFMHLWKIEHTE